MIGPRAIVALALAGCWTGAAPPPAPPPPPATVTAPADDARPPHRVEEDDDGPPDPQAPPGQLGVQQVRTGVQRGQTEVRACYERALQANPQLAGIVKVTFTIGRDGRVRAASATGMPAIDACVAAAVKRMVFPPPRGGGEVSVVYPYRFAPSP